MANYTKIKMSKTATADYAKFWYRNGDFHWFSGFIEHVDEAWGNWGDEITSTTGEEDPLIGTGRVSGRQYYFEPMMAMGWVRGGVYVRDFSEVYLMSPRLRDRTLLKSIADGIAEKYPRLVDVNADLYISYNTNLEEPGAFEEDLKISINSLVPKPSSKTDLKPEEFWEYGPADIWLERLRRERGVATLRKRRRIRARKLILLRK